MDAVALTPRRQAPSRFAGTVPRVVGGFEIEGLLGLGRDAKVYRARDPRARNAVALKVAAVELAPEFRLQSRLAHANLLRAHACGSDGALHWLALELAAGGTLMRSARLTDAELLRVMAQAADALAALHAQGWVHRDVKPAHLLLRADGSLALADFGCAARIGERDAAFAGTVVGTPLYAAPEQSQGAAAQPAADVYSLGVCLYELLTGAPPFPGRTLAELHAQHLMAPVPRLPEARARWQPLVDAMLAKQAAMRIADGGELRARLAPIEHDSRIGS